MGNLLLGAIFQRTPFDVYIHWLILSFGIGLIISGAAVLGSCRNIAGFFHLIKTDNSWWSRFYRGFYKYHFVYWWAFTFLLVLHLLVTIEHLGLPKAGEPYYAVQVVSLVTSITNFGLVLALQTSCRSAVNFINVFSTKNIIHNSGYLRFYKLHSILWWVLGFSVIYHMIFGIYHAVNNLRGGWGSAENKAGL
jgi:hypothetical protein